MIRTSFQNESRRTLQGRTDDRHRDVVRILAGTPITWRWGYDFAATHMAALAWDADALVRLEAMATRCGRRLLAVHSPDGPVWAWFGGRDPLGAKTIDELLDWQREQRGGVAFGEPASGLAGFRHSHEQALEACRIAWALGEKAVRFDAIALLALVAHEPRRATEFVEAELTPVLAVGPRAKGLLVTLQVYLEHGQRVGDTAHILDLSREKVRGQLNEIRALLAPRKIEERSAELLLALRLRPLRLHSFHYSH
jgi:hypothetical protein